MRTKTEKKHKQLAKVEKESARAKLSPENLRSKSQRKRASRERKRFRLLYLTLWVECLIISLPKTCHDRHLVSAHLGRKKRVDEDKGRRKKGEKEEKRKKGETTITRRADRDPESNNWPFTLGPMKQDPRLIAVAQLSPVTSTSLISSNNFVTA